jgi:hypothetical protein
MEGTLESPLRWPDSWPRTRFQDRKHQAAWKRTFQESVKVLLKELKLLGATSYMITNNGLAQPTEDSGVAVYFSLKPVDDYGWQEALGFIGEVPTIQQIDRAYMEKVRKIHPDGPTPDPVLFHELTKHRDRARAWAKGERTVEHEKVMAIDAFKEQRLNVNAIRLTLYAMRQIERCGSGVIMDRAWRGFSKQITAGAGGSNDQTA